MFIENSVLRFIEADVQDVVAMYRSTSSVMLSHGGRQRQPCEAFICVSNDGDRATVHVALSLMQSRSFVVFVPERQPSDKESSELVLKEAQAFVKGFGFEMQSINLKYSKALKEVILNDLRVVRPATAGRKTSQRKGSGDKSSRAQKDVPETKTGSGEMVSAENISFVREPGQQAVEKEIAQLQKESQDLSAQIESQHNSAAEMISALAAEIEKLKQAKKAGNDASARKIAAAKAEIDSLLSEKTAQDANAAEVLAALQQELEQRSVAKTSAEKERAREIAVLKTELEGFSLSTDLEGELASLQDEIKRRRADKSTAESRFQTEVFELRQEIATLEEEIAALELKGNEEASALKAEREKRAQKKEQLAGALDLNLQTLRSEIEQLGADIAARNEAAEAELVALTAERKRLLQNKSDADQSRSAEILEIQAEIERIEDEKKSAEESHAATVAELVLLQAKVASLAAEKIAAERAFAREKEALTFESERLVAEKAEMEKAAKEELAVVKAEVERRAEEKAACEKNVAAKVSAATAAVQKIAAEKEALERLSEQEPATLPGKDSGPVIPPQESVRLTETPARVNNEPPPPVTQPYVGQKIAFAESPVDFFPAEAASSAEVDEADPFAFLQSEDSHDFRSRHTFDRKDRKSSSEQTTFVIDTAKKRVEYLDPEDLLEIYTSLNRARVAMGNNTTETCDAYVFSLQENGNLRVYIALYLVDRKDILVYVPEQQPVDDEDLSRIMADGFDFIEIVGFLMDPMDLGHDAESRQTILDKIPVLQRIDH